MRHGNGILVRSLISVLTVGVLIGCAEEARPAYGPSKVIGAVRFAPVESIRIAAKGSDNWPMTWADDGDIYTSYGDGRGFKPRVEKKLSLGLARITGGPEDWKGVNLRAPSIERTGDGASGAKTSGMLMVDGVLYALIRNTGNCTLAWSEDRGKTWTWGFKFEVSFGFGTLLNFGQNYAGARDDYVYAYTSDGGDNYVIYDRVILARVPRSKVRERGAWEFLERFEEAGDPVWTADIAKRGGIFFHEDNCANIGVAYHPGLKRYLLTLGAGPGVWGMYDAPEPWGPWTTVFHTSEWDVGDTHTYHIPTKWMRDDHLYLVFSGRKHEGVQYDSFCVRRMDFRRIDKG